MKTGPSSKVSRTVIYISVARTKVASYFGHSLLDWMFKGGGWKPKESPKAKKILVNDRVRKELMLVLRDMSTGVYTPEVEKLFSKIGLPIAFKIDKVSLAHTGWDQPTEYIVSGTGDETKFIKWLEQKQIKYEVRNVVIQQQ